MSNENSVEWIIKQLIFKTEFENLPNHYVLMSDKDIDSIIDQAKEMHREEMIDFAMKFMMQDRPIISFYNETFGGNK